MITSGVPGTVLLDVNGTQELCEVGALPLHFTYD